MTKVEAFMSPVAAAEKLALTRQRVYQLMSDGSIRTETIYGKTVCRADDVEKVRKKRIAETKALLATLEGKSDGR